MGTKQSVQKNAQNEEQRQRASASQMYQEELLPAASLSQPERLLDDLPNHPTARPLRQAAVLQMQRQRGNAYVLRQLAQRQCACGVPDQSQAKTEELQRQEEEVVEEEGFEVGGQLMMTPSWHVIPLPARAAQLETKTTMADVHRGEAPELQRTNGADACHTPTQMRALISGSFEGGKTLDDYYPDLVGGNYWGSNATAGPFDNGSRAGSAVQLIGEYPSPCAPGTGSNFTLGQSATIVRARANGAKMMENGKALEGQTINDIARSGRDQSKAPFRQEYGFAVTMADPISGIPYNTLTSYEWEVNLTTSITGSGGAKSVNWGVTVEASNGTVTKNTVR